MTAQEIRFKRGEFHGKYRDTEPKWHIFKPNDDGGWILRAVCGFEYRNVLGDAKISRAKSRPKVTLMCSRCLKEAIL